jgi:lipopolysaccharide export system protein LptC
MTGAPFQSVHHYWLPLVIIGGLALTIAWLDQVSQAPEAYKARPIGHDPDYFVEDFTATAYDVDGQPRYRLAAVRMVHYMDDDTTELEAPRFTREGDGAARVLVRALQGRVSPDGEYIDFTGDVRLLREYPQQAVPMELSTERLRVLPEQDRMSSDTPVLIKDGRGELRGGSLLADGQQQVLELKGRVKGIYVSRH